MADLDAVIATIADDFVRQYKYDREEAVTYFSEQLHAAPELLAMIREAATLKHVLRNAAFKAFLKRHKKALYYRKRVYRLDDAAVEEQLVALATRTDRKAAVVALANLHISSRERLAENDAFYQALAPWLTEASSILDVGCGVQPMLFPFNGWSGRYAALDRDGVTTRVLREVKSQFPEHYTGLQPATWHLSEGWDNHADKYDLALLLKLVPVVARQEPELLDVLAATPANRWVISGVKEAMVKRQDVEKRERQTIRKFIASSGKSIVGEFDLSNEFFYVVA